MIACKEREGGGVGGGGELLPVTALDFEFSARQAHASIPQLTKTSH